MHGALDKLPRYTRRRVAKPRGSRRSDGPRCAVYIVVSSEVGFKMAAQCARMRRTYGRDKASDPGVYIGEGTREKRAGVVYIHTRPGEVDGRNNRSASAVYRKG
jgi:hypothetical protein